ncbi:MAG: serine protease, partial [Thermotogota bacterium]|nr:serine protease [Thermotogota bacterium]
PSQTLYNSIRTIYNDIADELKLTTPFNPIIELAGKETNNYLHKRALIESFAGGSHKFISKGELIKQQTTEPQGITKTSIQDNRSFEGWNHGYENE